MNAKNINDINGLIFDTYLMSLFRPNQAKNMAAMDNTCFWYIKNLLLRNRLAKWINILFGASIGGPLSNFLISSQSH